MKRKLVMMFALVLVLCTAQSALAWSIVSFRTWFDKNKEGKNVTKYEMVIDDSNWQLQGRRILYVFYDSKRRPVATFKRLNARLTVRHGRDMYEESDLHSGECVLEDGFNVGEYPNYEAAGNPVSVRYSNGQYIIVGSCVGEGWHYDIERVSVIRVTSPVDD